MQGVGQRTAQPGGNAPAPPRWNFLHTRSYRHVGGDQPAHIAGYIHAVGHSTCDDCRQGGDLPDSADRPDHGLRGHRADARDRRQARAERNRAGVRERLGE